MYYPKNKMFRHILQNSLTFGEALKLIRSRKFCLPFSFLFVLFLAIGWSGFAYLALNGVGVIPAACLAFWKMSYIN